MQRFASASLSDPNRQQVIALVLMPREAFSAEVRVRIQNALENRLKGKLLYYYLRARRRATPRACISAFTRNRHLPRWLRKIEAEIAALARTWDDRLREIFGQQIRRHARARNARAMGPRVYARIQGRVRRRTRSAADAEHIERLLSDGGFEVELNHRPSNGDSRAPANSGCMRSATRRFSPS